MKNYSQGMHKINLWSCLASISLFVALSVLIASIGEVLSGYNFGIFNYVFLILLVLNFLSAIVFGILAAIKTSKRKRVANIIISSISFVGLSAALIPTIILIKIGIDFKNDEERYEQKLKEKFMKSKNAQIKRGKMPGINEEESEEDDDEIEKAKH